MPGLDRTGPMGAGPMTGGAKGFCNPATSGYPSRFAAGGFRGVGLRRGFRGGYGPGMGCGYARGFGWCRVSPVWAGGYPPATSEADAMTPENELNILRADADAVKNELDAINRRIEELEKKSAEES